MRRLLFAPAVIVPSLLVASYGAQAQGTPSADQIIRALRPSGPLLPYPLRTILDRRLRRLPPCLRCLRLVHLCRRQLHRRSKLPHRRST